MSTAATSASVSTATNPSNASPSDSAVEKLASWFSFLDAGQEVENEKAQVLDNDPGGGTPTRQGEAGAGTKVDNISLLKRMPDGYQAQKPASTSFETTLSERVGVAQVDARKALWETKHAEDGGFQLMKDTFSLMFICNVKSTGFVYSLLFFALQVAILCLISVNLLKDAPDGNPLKAPLRTSLDVIVAQALALFVSLITQSDVIATFDLVSVLYDGNVQSVFEGATYAKWIISNLCRCAVGLLSIAVTFIFIVQSTTVLELFFNFAAVQFVSDLDNIAFQLAHKGYVIGRLEQMTRKFIRQVQFPQKKMIMLPSTKRSISAKGLRIFFFSVLMTFLYIGWVVIRTRQANGFYLEQVCQTFDLRFGDQFYDFFVNQPCDEDSCLWKDRTRPLHYGPFSDFYEASRGRHGNLEWKGHRPVYYQRNLKNGFGEGSPPGKFSYCESEEAWVFTIDAVTKAKEDECNWLLRSPKTEAYTLGEAPTTGWSIWTGVLVPTDSFELACGECVGEVDCNYHGRCENKKCVCEPLWGGKSCQTCIACSQLERKRILVQDNDWGSDSSITEDTVETFLRLNGTEAYDRPVYYHYNIEDYQYTITGSIELMFYAGTRFYLVAWEGFISDPSLGVQDNEFGRLREYFATFHSTWHLDDNENRTMLFYTDTTRAPMPLDVTWNRASESDLPVLVSQEVSGGVIRVDDLKFDCAFDEEKSLCAYKEPGAY